MFLSAFIFYVICANSVLAAADSDCWWTGCQPLTWGVRGCSSYNRTEVDKRPCTDGHEFHCCLSVSTTTTTQAPPTSANGEDCWWTGCQPKSWGVRGCQQYERVEAGKRPCDNGDEFQCCTKPATPTSSAPACWWTGCQKNDWAVRGCQQYGKIENERRACDNGNEYYCCDAPPAQNGPRPSTEEELVCSFTECLLGNSSTINVCPEGTSHREYHVCDNGGTMIECCGRVIPIDDNINSLTGESYEDFVKFLFLQDSDFTLQPDSLACESVDPGKKHVVQIGQEGIRICDLCPNLPQRKLANIFLDRVPSAKQSNVDFKDCFGLCFEEKSCVTLTYDEETATCYMFDSTAGSYVEDSGWVTVLMTQPTGILQDWTYTRHTRLIGTRLASSQQPDFPRCLESCDQMKGCNFVGYSFSTKDCGFYASETDLIYVDMVYGFISAFRTSAKIDKNELTERFFQLGDDLTLSKAKTVDGGKCAKFRNETHNAHFSQSCIVSGSAVLGCDQSTGCKLCYYPEAIEEFQNLGICPDSEYERRSELKSEIRKRMEGCLGETSCVGVNYNAGNGEISTLNLMEATYKDYTTRYMLKYPTDDNRKYLQKYDLVPNGELEPIQGVAGFQNAGSKSFEQCKQLFESKSEFSRMSFSFETNSCRLSSEKSSLKLRDKGRSVVLFKKPPLTSSYINYLRTPGYVISSGTPRATNERCSGNCEEVCSRQCNSDFKEWCAYISVETSRNGGKCRFYDDDSEFSFQINPEGTIFSKTTALDFTLEGLNKLSAFQDSDVYDCFQQPKELTQTSLTIYNSTNSENRGLRVRRGIGDFFKNLGKSIVNGFKSVGRAIVNTAKGAVNTVKNLVKGDLKAAKDSFLKIPIVDLGKNVVELGGAVVTGDWNKAKKKGLDILESDGFELVTAVAVPGAGKLITSGVKAGVKTVQAATKAGARTIAKGAKGKADDVAKSSRKVDNKSKDKPDKKKNEKADKEREEKCDNKRSRRATANPPPVTGKRKRVGACDKKDKKDQCARPNINHQTVIASTLKSCDKKNPGSTCEFECLPGYTEYRPSVKCEKKGNTAAWSPIPRCDLDRCSAGGNPLIVLQTPQSTRYGVKVLGDFITAYVVQFDKSRKLPDWSVALHQSSQFKSRNYNSATDVKRASGFTNYPCTALAAHQATNADYLRSGWDRGHLTPANVARWSEKAKKVSNLYINVAPQDPHSNQGPWKFLEGHVQCFSEKFRAVVATGVCSTSLSDRIRTIAVPSCFWKMVCYRDEQSNHQVVGFYSSNSHVKTNAEKERRKEEILKPLSQGELLAKATGASIQAWLRPAKDLNTGRPVSIQDQAVWFPVNVFECAKAMKLSEEEKTGWSSAFAGSDGILKRGSNVDKNKSKRETALKRGCHGNELKDMLDIMGFFSGSDEDTVTEESDKPIDEGDGSTMVNVQSCGKRIVGYYTSWGDKSIGGRELQRLTHVIYAFLEMRADGSIDIGSADRKNAEDVDEETRKSKRRLEALLKSAERYPHLKVLFAIGGWENSQYFSSVAASPDKRLTFITSVIKMIDRYGFDGVDVDWEYPVTGGADEGVPADKENYVILMKELRTALDNLASKAGRSEKYLISFAGAAGQWTLDPGYDLPNLFKYIDFVNIMTYDYFGAWASKWGAYTGPPSPLYFGMPPGFSGKTNADWSVKYYTCKTKQPHKVNMGVPFYGRYWNNVGDSVDGKDEMWRTASSVNGKFEGGYVPWHKVKSEYLNNGAYKKGFHEKAKAPYAWNPSERKFLGYEDRTSLEHKVKYAVDKNVGGLMIWALELDDDDLSLLDVVYKAPLCQKTNPNDVNHKCSPIDEKRWWTPEDSDENAGMCGRSAPLYKGYYPVCDPDDPGYSCCGNAGYCGTGPKYCDCPTCKNYREDPKTILEEPIKPSIPVTWYLMNDPDGKRGRCGRKIPKIGEHYPTCNPDDENNYCCSNGGYCGNTDEYCKCNGCINFKKDPKYKFGPKKWWTLEDGKDLGGRCGPKAPKVDGIYEAECEGTSNFHCCSPSGWCGSGSDFCDCKGCKNFRK